MRALIIAICLSGFSSPALAQPFACSNSAISPHPNLATAEHDHRRLAPAAPGPLMPFTAFFSTFDDTDDDTGDGQADIRVNPEFVVYELRGVAPNESGAYVEPPVSITRPRDWYASPELIPIVSGMPGVTNFRLDNSYDGIGTIWNRGHLTMSEHAQRISAEAACNTHVFWNASPQAQDLNQGPWRHLENYSAAAANKYRSVWIIAGPIFDSATPHLTIGDSGEVPIEIPDGFFKIIAHEGPAGLETLAFVYEQPNALNADGIPVPTATWVNCNQAQRLRHSYDHTGHLTSIAEIERRTGLQFFTNRPDREALIAAQAAALWPVEQRFWDPDSTCADQRGHP